MAGLNALELPASCRAGNDVSPVHSDDSPSRAERKCTFFGEESDGASSLSSMHSEDSAVTMARKAARDDEARGWMDGPLRKKWFGWKSEPIRPVRPVHPIHPPKNT